MFVVRVITIAMLSLAAGMSSAAMAQERLDPAALAAAQREAMTRFAAMDGEWRGPAWVLLPSGEKRAFIQTERVGPFLGGTIKVIEGRAYNEDGSVGFNALGIISYAPEAEEYRMRSYAQGRVGDFLITPTADGFEWEIAAGPMTIRYAAKIQDGEWWEVGDRLAPDQEPVRFIEMRLQRVGDSAWPAAGAVLAE